MGYMDEDGFLFLTDRTANLIISGGVNIYPAEVDAVLLQHPAWATWPPSACPTRSGARRSRPWCSWPRASRRTPELAAELMEFCRAHLAHFKCPRTVDFVDQLPREDTGKIFKRKLRDQYRAWQPRPTR
jgi:long-chain acyl-CoA synthetase